MWKNQKFVLLFQSARVSATATIPPIQLQCYQFSQSAFKSVVRNYQCRAADVTRKDSYNCNTSTRNMKRCGYACVFKYYHCDGAAGGATLQTRSQKIRTDKIPVPVQAQQWHLSVRHLVQSTSSAPFQEQGGIRVRSCRSSWLGSPLSSSPTAHLLTWTRSYSSSSKSTWDVELDTGSRTGAKISDHPLSPKKGEDSSSDSESDSELETIANRRTRHSKDDGVEIIYFRGLPQITVPLPSRREKCRFILKPLTNSVGDLIQMIRTEDKGVDHISIQSKDGVRIASSNTIEMLMEQDFSLIINDILYEVVTPPQEKPSKEDLERLSSVRNLVGQLYAALNVDEHQLRLEREILAELEKLQVQLNPLEEKRDQLSQISSKRTTILTWAGLGLMSVQFGILARLTWYEYSWDIMEPVTYFVTYGTAMLCYAYFVLTKQDYVLPEVRDRQYLIQFHKNAKKVGLDVEKYNELRSKIAVLETNLHRLRDPLSLHLPPSKSRPLDLSKLDSLGGDASFIQRAQQKVQELLKKTRNPS